MVCIFSGIFLTLKISPPDFPPNNDGPDNKNRDKNGVKLRIFPNEFVLNIVQTGARCQLSLIELLME